MENIRAEILVNGLVQGVGFRFFVYKNAVKIGLNGFTENLYSGEVLTIVEGPKYLIEEFFEIVKIGPRHADVKNASIIWSDFKNDFSRFEIKY